MTRKNAAAITVHPQPSTAHNLRSERGGEATFSISKERSRQIFQPLEAETWASWSKEKDRKGIVGRARGGGQGPSCGRGEGIFAALSAFEPCKCVIRWKETRALVEQARGTRDGRKSRHVPTLKSDPSSNFCSNPAHENSLEPHFSRGEEREEENERLGEAQVRERKLLGRHCATAVRAKRPAPEAVYSRLLARSLASSVCFPALLHLLRRSLRARVPVLSLSLSRSRVVVSRGDRPLGDRLEP